MNGAETPTDPKACELLDSFMRDGMTEANAVKVVRGGAVIKKLKELLPDCVITYEFDL
jgi:hypothetical protein